MAIDPKLLVVKPVDELALVEGLQEGDILFYDGSANLKRMPVDTFNNISKSAKPLSPTDTTPTAEGLYIPTVAGTYPNGLVAKDGFYTLFFLSGTTWTKAESEFPKDIPLYDSSHTYLSGNTFYKDDQIYVVKNSQTLNPGELPEDNVGIKVELFSVNVDQRANLFLFKSGTNNIDGERNIGIGQGAIRYNNSDSDNVAIGVNALSNRTAPGDKNIAIGSGALYNNEGSANVGIGYDSISMAKGSDNVGVGLSANNGVTNGNKNTAVGSGANVNGDWSYTVALGAGAIAEKTGQVIIGNDNFTELKFFGRIVTKDHGVYYGDFVKWNYFMAGAGRDDYSNNTSLAYGNVGIGHLALQNVNNSMMNTAVGHQALQKLTGGADHTAVGAGALQKQTDGVGCTAMGRLAMANSTIGTNNTGLGDTALEFNIDGNSNTSVGYSSGIKAGGSNNTFMGTFAGGHYLARNGPLCIFNNTVAIGAATLQYNETFHNNTIVGTYSAHSVQGGDNATLGYETLRNATSTNRNTALGTGAGFWLQSGDNNVFIGYNSGRDGQLRTVSGSTVIGANAYSTRNNEIVIGNGSETHVTISGVVFTKAQLIALKALVS